MISKLLKYFVKFPLDRFFFYLSSKLRGTAFVRLFNLYSFLKLILFSYFVKISILLLSISDRHTIIYKRFYKRTELLRHFNIWKTSNLHPENTASARLWVLYENSLIWEVIIIHRDKVIQLYLSNDEVFERSKMSQRFSFFE